MESSLQATGSSAAHNHSPTVGFAFFNPAEAATVEAVAARIIPADAASPGAREARVVIYIDRAVAGYYRDLQSLYRRGLRALDDACRLRHGKAFIELAEAEQDALLSQIESPVEQTLGAERGAVGSVPEGHTREEVAVMFRGQALLTRFFMVVRAHTIEGMFCDPLYGGNHDAVGWKLIGFPGTQWGYSATQMQPGFDAAQIPTRTLADLYREHGRSAGRRKGEE